jgi:hypothetical protein
MDEHRNLAANALAASAPADGLKKGLVGPGEPTIPSYVLGMAKFKQMAQVAVV